MSVAERTQLKAYPNLGRDWDLYQDGSWEERQEERQAQEVVTEALW